MLGQTDSTTIQCSPRYGVLTTNARYHITAHHIGVIWHESESQVQAQGLPSLSSPFITHKFQASAAIITFLHQHHQHRLSRPKSSQIPGINGRLEMNRKCEIWRRRVFLHSYFASSLIRLWDLSLSRFCGLIKYSERSISSKTLDQSLLLAPSADDDCRERRDNDNFERGQSGGEARNKRLVRGNQVSSNWSVSQVYAFSFIAPIPVSITLLLPLINGNNTFCQLGCTYRLFHACIGVNVECGESEISTCAVKKLLLWPKRW